MGRSWRKGVSPSEIFPRFLLMPSATPELLFLTMSCQFFFSIHPQMALFASYAWFVSAEGVQLVLLVVFLVRFLCSGSKNHSFFSSHKSIGEIPGLGDAAIENIKAIATLSFIERMNANRYQMKKPKIRKGIMQFLQSHQWHNFGMDVVHIREMQWVW